MKPEFFLYTRRQCRLCTEMESALRAMTGESDFAWHVIEIDSDPELMNRYGTRVPVLVAGGRTLCEAHFDPEAIAGYLQDCARAD